MKSEKPEALAPKAPFSVVDFLASVKLSIILLLLVAGLAVVGTLIPQGEVPAGFAERWGKVPARFLEVLGFFDVYRSWWFQAVLAALGVNLLVCSLKRFPGVWKVVRSKGAGFTPSRFEKLSGELRVEAVMPGLGLERAGELAAGAARRSFRKVSLAAGPGGATLYAESGRITRLGYFIVHAGFLLVLMGALAGSIAGFSGKMNITEGESLGSVDMGGRKMELPFSIRLDRFSASYYSAKETGGDQMPKEYKSEVTILEGGKPVRKAEILVNAPLSYRGLTFYQADFGQSFPEKAEIVFTDPASGLAASVSAPMGRRLPLPMGQKGDFELADYAPDFSTMKMNLGPVFLVVLHRPGAQDEEVLVPVKYPRYDAMRKGSFIISAGRYESKPYTGLQVTRDPGVPLVYAGFIFIILGSFVAFFLSHRQLYGKISADGAGSRLVLTGIANKNLHGLSARLHQIARRLEAGRGDRK